METSTLPSICLMLPSELHRDNRLFVKKMIAYYESKVREGLDERESLQPKSLR